MPTLLSMTPSKVRHFDAGTMLSKSPVEFVARATEHAAAAWDLQACKKFWVHASLIRQEVQTQYNRMKNSLRPDVEELFKNFFRENRFDTELQACLKKVYGYECKNTYDAYKQMRHEFNLPIFTPPIFAPDIFSTSDNRKYAKSFDVTREAVHMSSFALTPSQLETFRQVRDNNGRCYFEGSSLIFPSREDEKIFVAGLAEKARINERLMQEREIKLEAGLNVDVDVDIGKSDGDEGKKCEKKQCLRSFVYDDRFKAIVGRDCRGWSEFAENVIEPGRREKLERQFDALPVFTTTPVYKSLIRARGPHPGAFGMFSCEVNLPQEDIEAWHAAFKHVYQQLLQRADYEAGKAHKAGNCGQLRLRAIQHLVREGKWVMEEGWKDEYVPDEKEGDKKDWESEWDMQIYIKS